jgi:excisionase family DNA binding protein
MTRSETPVSVRLLTVNDVADALQLSTRTVRRMIAAKQIPIIRLGRSVRVHPSVISQLYSNDRK